MHGGTVFGLCASWCGTCRGWEAVLARAAQAAGWAAHYVDVEVHDALVEAVDVEDFPTVLLVDAQGTPRFAGTVLPHGQTLTRLMQAVAAGGLPGVSEPSWLAAAERLMAAKAALPQPVAGA